MPTGRDGRWRIRRDAARPRVDVRNLAGRHDERSHCDIFPSADGRNQAVSDVHLRERVFGDCLRDMRGAVVMCVCFPFFFFPLPSVCIGLCRNVASLLRTTWTIYHLLRTT